MRTTILERTLLLAIVATATLHAATTQAGSDGPDPKRGSIEVRVDTIGKEDFKGSLLACSLRDGVVIRHEGGERRVPIRDVVRIVTETTVAAPGRHDMLFNLNNGDRIVGTVAGARDEAVVVQTADLGEIVVPLEWIKRMDTSIGREPNHKDVADWFHARRDSDIATAAKPDEDVILLTNGDIVQGFVTAIDTKGISIETQSGDTLVPYPLVLAVRLAATALSKENLCSPLPTPYLQVTFRHSGRLTVTELDWSADVARIRLRNDREFTVEAQRIVRVDVVGGRWEWLSTHQPISYRHTPMLSLAWEFKPDRNVLGNTITVAGQAFERGIGVHSRSSLIYDLKGDYREFVTHFGMDDDSGPYAHVSVVILVDGKRRFEKHGVRRRKLYGPFSIDVKLAKRIELIVDFGKNGDVQDRFNWVEPALVR